MKISSSLATAALAVAAMPSSASAQDCTTYQHSMQAPDGVPMTLDYVADMSSGIFRGQVTYEGQGWVGFGISPAGFMAGSQAVIGLAEGETNAGVNRYMLDGYTVEQVMLMDFGAPRDVTESFVQNATHTVMTFAMPLVAAEEEFNIRTDGTNQIFLLAAGTSNTLAYHAHRTPMDIVVEPCEDTAVVAGDAQGLVESYSGMTAQELANIAVGDEITHEGFVLDQFCIDQGFFLDQPDLVSLENPAKHTVHCLIDAPPCIATPFEILMDPAEGETTWTRAFVLDQESKDQVVALAKTLGGPSCTECDGEGHLLKGFRVRVGGTVTALADAATGIPATLSITELEAVFPFTGQEIELEGYISDQFCLDAGVFLDNGLPSLEMPEAHTVHCLIDPPPCINSPFEVLLEPKEGETEYQRGYTLDQPSKDQAVALAKSVGVCDECDGTGTIVEGFQARFDAIVLDHQRNLTSGSGPLISVTSLDPVYPLSAPLPPVDLSALAVGDEILYEGFVLDQYCINEGVFLDQPDLVALENPDKHTVHCLIDAPPCIATPFEILSDPAEGETVWGRAFVLDEASKDAVVALAKTLGGPSCTECNGEGHLLKGLRVRVGGTVTALADAATGVPATISVSNLQAVFPYTGQSIEVEGYISDQFCLDAGVFLDNGLPSLEMPDKHTVHCLIDPPPCINSPFEVLLDPEEGETLYQRGYTLDGPSKDEAVALAKSVGVCDECDGTGTIVEGFRAMLDATILDGSRNLTSGSGPLISVNSIEPVYPEDQFTVGQEISIEGYVTDQFCIQRGTFLDTGLVTLENADMHTLHCLLDPPPCLDSPFEILIDPDHSVGETMWSRGFTLDDASKELVIALGREVGNCDTCTGGETGQLAGFRVRLTATIVDSSRNLTSGSGPLISVSNAESVGQYSVGQSVQVEGYVVDTFCIDEGVFLDTGLPTLPNGDKHTVHCLIDAPPCIASPFEILLDPHEEGGDYTRGFTLDQDGKDAIVALAKEVGGPSCTECDGTGSLEAGFRVLITGEVVDNTRNVTTGQGPLISVTNALWVEPPEPVLAVGDEITIEGYVTDQFCIERGNFLDTGLPTLEFADRHTVHCLLDPPPCLDSPFEILMDPDYVAGETIFSRGWVLDEDSKEQVIALGREVGNCDTCSGGETGQLAGFRVRLTANIVEIGDEEGGGLGVISVTEVESVGQYSVGQIIQVEGYVIDTFCIQQEAFLDTGLPPLENGDKHTLHCLVDAPPCIASAYEIVYDPIAEGDRWTRAFTLDQASKDTVVALAKEVGGPSCTECDGTGTLEEGFRVLLTAEVVDNMWNMTTGSGPLISIINAEAVLPAEESTACELPPVTLTFSEVPITLTYELGVDDATGMGTFSAEVVYEGIGWVGFAISESGSMVGSLAVIGLPDEEVSESNPGKYFLGGFAPAQVTPVDQQTLLDGNIEQNDTHTVLTFTKFLMEPDELAINPSGENFFLVAAGGSGNELAYHGTARHSFTETLACPSADGGLDVAVGDVITIEGFVMDNFCIERGTLLDAPTIVTLEEPNLHSFHCLLDVPDCVASDYEILMDPLPGQSMYRRVLTLDEASKEMVIDLARALGSCDTCSGAKATHGFRANITATVMDLGNEETGAPPMVAVSDIEPVLFVTDSSTEVTLEVGDKVTVTGFIMDNFCIERGTLLDAPTIVTLEQPDRHSVHCLIDVPQCAASNYEVLLDPAPGSEDGLYTRGFVLDDAAKTLVRDLAMEVGVCDDCDGTGDWEFGFRARVQGTVTALGSDGEPPVISVQMATPVPFDGMMGMEEEPMEPAGPTTTATDGEVDCTQFQVSYMYPGTMLTLEYVLLFDEATGEGNYSARVTYEGQGWVGFAVSPSGAMVGSEAIIGLPGEAVGEGNPGVYDLNSQSPAGVVLADASRQSIILESNIEQNDTHTVLTFVRSLEGSVPIVPDASNWFLTASGSDNALGFHNGRGNVEVVASPCTAEGGGASAIVGGGGGDRKESHFQAHGWLACIAWGILVPIAIGNSLARHLIPVQGLWFEVHRAFNSLAIVLTIIAFAIVVNALETTSSNPEHFKPIEGGGALGKHKTIGLVVFILSLIQGIGGVMRPHLPAKNDDGSDAEPKSAVRTMWEFIHKGSGIAILAMAWYQCHSGLKTYAQNFQAQDYTDVFWGVTGAISAIVVVGALTRFIMPAEAAPKQDHMPVPGEDEQPAQQSGKSWQST